MLNRWISRFEDLTATLIREAGADLILFIQDLLPAVRHPPPGKHPVQEKDLQGGFHRYLQPRGSAHRVGAAGGERRAGGAGPVGHAPLHLAT